MKEQSFPEPSSVEEAVQRRTSIKLELKGLEFKIAKTLKGSSLRRTLGDQLRELQLEIMYLNEWLRQRKVSDKCLERNGFPSRGGMNRIILICIHAILTGDEARKRELAEQLGQWLEDSDDGLNGVWDYLLGRRGGG